jgi:hypothetical protein
MTPYRRWANWVSIGGGELKFPQYRNYAGENSTERGGGEPVEPTQVNVCGETQT